MQTLLSSDFTSFPRILETPLRHMAPVQEGSSRTPPSNYREGLGTEMVPTFWNVCALGSLECLLPAVARTTILTEGGGCPNCSHAA